METNYTHVIILDFEATCDDNKQVTPQEIIEFPSVIVSLAHLEVGDEFSSFVRPYHNPKLTNFCKELTSITQADVDRAPLFPEVLKNHELWLEQNGLTESNSLFITCGEWDFATMFPAQLKVSDPLVENFYPIYTKWLNIKKLFCSVLNRTKAPGMARMMGELNLPLTGHHHRGIDDCRNIAKIFCELAKDGPEIFPSSELPASKYPPIHLQFRYGDTVESVVLTYRTLEGLWSLAQKTFHCTISAIHQLDGTNISEPSQLLTLMHNEELVLQGFSKS